MQKKIIIESGMQFGPYDRDDLFSIEKSDQYLSCDTKSVCSCEFLLRHKGKLLFVEAKTSCPNYAAKDTSAEKKKKYDAYVDEITKKMRHSLMLYGAMLAGRHTMETVGENIVRLDMAKTEIVLVLVVKDAEASWLVPYVDVFREKLRPEMCMWHIRSFMVINEAAAIRRGLTEVQP